MKNLLQNYKTEKLGKLAKIKRNKELVTTLKGQEKPVLNSAHISLYGNRTRLNRELVGDKDRFFAQKGDLCINGVNPELAFVCSNDVWLISRDYFTVELTDESVITEFIQILFISGVLQGQIDELSTGKKKILGVKGAQELKIPLPPKETQKKIVSKWNEEAEKEKAYIDNLTKLEELFKDVDKQITENEIEEVNFRWVDKSRLTSEYFSPEYYILAQKKEGDSIKLGEIADVQGGLNLEKYNWSEDGVPVYGNGSLINGYFDGRPIGYLEGRPTDTGSCLNYEDLIVCVMGKDTIGRAGVYTEGNTGLINQSLTKVTPRLKGSDTYFLAVLFNTESIRKQLKAYSRGSQQRYVGKDDLSGIELSLLDDEIQVYYREKYIELTEKLRQMQEAIISPKVMAERLLREFL